MVKTLFRSLLLLLVAATAQAQLPHWELIYNDQGDMANMQSMVFTSHDTGYIFSGSKMIRTTDSGMHFTALKLPNKVSGRQASNMSWPTNNDGYVAFSSNSDHTLMIRTHDAGNTWDTAAVKPENLGFSHIEFPTPSIGYATGGYHTASGEDTGAFVAKTTDGGSTWNLVYKPSGHSIKDQIVFSNASKGIFFDVINGNSLVVDYTYDGASTVTVGHPYGIDNGGSRFLFMMDDSTWIANPGGPAELDRTTDSGRTWTTVVKNGPFVPEFDPSTGAITAACFNGKLGFAFEDLGSICFVTTDAGASWIQSSTKNSHISVLSFASAASFPSPTIAYVLGTDSATLTDKILLKITLPAPVIGGGVAMAAPAKDGFRVSVDGQSISFSARAAAEGRSIEILDLLGRPCAEVRLGSNAETARMTRSDLRPGTYFARLGDACAKFTIWN